MDFDDCFAEALVWHLEQSVPKQGRLVEEQLDEPLGQEKDGTQQQWQCTGIECSRDFFTTHRL